MDEVLLPPERFGIVEPQVFRSSVFHPENFSFISRLGLKTIVHLSPEITMPAVSQFIDKNNIQLIHLGMKFWKPTGWKPASEELLKEALELVLNVSNHPLMLMCTSGIHQSGTVVGCLRRLQNHSFSSIIGELRSYAIYTHTRYFNESVIEFFDTDLINVPTQKLPEWYSRSKCIQEETMAFIDNGSVVGNVVADPYLKRIVTNSVVSLKSTINVLDDKLYRNSNSVVTTETSQSNDLRLDHPENEYCSGVYIIEFGGTK